MSEKLSLEKISARYGRCTKTFKKLTIEFGIPHEKLGRSMIFDPGKVAAHLEQLAQQQPGKIDLKRRPVKRQSTKTKDASRYQEMLGL